ncbi:MAG: hypothetical protein ACREF4_13755 [Gammaproteobacteria bacterium]
MTRGTRLGIAALAGAVVLLALLNLHLWSSPVDISPVAPPPGKAEAPHPDSTALVTALDKKTADEFRDTVRRPLFNPDRRPIERKETAAPKAEASDLRLVGVMKAANQPPRALLRSAGEPNGKWVAEGGEFNGWKLSKVNERSVVLQSGGRSQDLQLAVPRRPPDEPPPARQ